MIPLGKYDELKIKNMVLATNKNGWNHVFIFIYEKCFYW